MGVVGWLAGLRYWLPGWFLFLVAFFNTFQTARAEEDDFLTDESVLEEEQQFPDLVRVDETGGIMDEFALLEETMSANEVVSASKHRQSIFWSPSAITVFTREDIQASGARDLPDLLRRVPGFDVYRLKSAYPLTGARALTDESNNLVLLLVDGREDLIEYSGIILWSALSIDLAEIERVEVIRGPGSALYGSNAFSAIVSVTTMADRPRDGGDVYLQAGEQGQSRLFGNVRGAYPLGDGVLSYSAGLGIGRVLSPSDAQDEAMSVFRTHGIVRYREGKQLDLSLHAGLMSGGGTLHIHMGDMQVTDSQNPWVMFKSDLALSENSRFKAQAYYVRYRAEIHYRADLRAYDMWIGTVPDISQDFHAMDLQLQYDWQATEDLLLIAGGNLRYIWLDWENLIVSDDDELRGAGFVHLQYSPWDQLQLTGGLRFDFNTSNSPALSPRAVAVFRPGSDHALRLGYGLAFRKPSYFESRVHMLISEYNPAMPEFVEVMAGQLGNEHLTNEKVHTIEVGWRGNFLDQSLQTSLDLFYSRYLDTIAFEVEVPTRLGLPDIANSTIQYQNQEQVISALGGEAELAFRPQRDWYMWANLGVRRVVDAHSGEQNMSDPTLRANLGARCQPSLGLQADLALHYVSGYRMRMVDPINPLDDPRFMHLGERWLMIGRLGYRTSLDAERSLEAGFTLQAPLGVPFREYAGTHMPEAVQTDTASDFGGEQLTRMLAFYLRGSF